MPKPGDVVVRKHLATRDRDGVAIFYTLQRVPHEEKLGGPWDSQAFARERASSLAARKQAEAWMEVAPASGTYQLIEPLRMCVRQSRSVSGEVAERKAVLAAARAVRSHPTKVLGMFQGPR
jgi:hypothetical protein